MMPDLSNSPFAADYAASIPQPEPTPGDTSWFTHDRFGLFIHWGLYAIAARHEWVQSHEKMTSEQYRKYFTHLTPICMTRMFGPKPQATRV